MKLARATMLFVYSIG